MLNTSKIRFLFEDGTQKEILIHDCFKGIRKNGERPISACIDLYGTIGFEQLRQLCEDILIALSVGSKFDDVKVFGIVPQERMNG